MKTTLKKFFFFEVSLVYQLKNVRVGSLSDFCLMDTLHDDEVQTVIVIKPLWLNFDT